MGRRRGFKAKLSDRDRGFAELMKVVAESAGGAYVKVGVLGDERPAGSNLSTAEIAAVNEFGTTDGRIPERPAFRSTFEEQREHLTEDARRLILGWIDGKISIKVGLEAMGAKLVAAVRKKITSGAGVPPPNAPSTIRAKGSSRPLVDTGHMINSITSAVVAARNWAARRLSRKAK